MNFHEYLKYNPETGEIIWITKPSARINIGSIAGSIRQDGYLRITFNKKNFYLHRIAWYLHYGVWPKGEIDHINGIKTDNRISNLRDVTKSENCLNRKKHREKTVKYYCYSKEAKKWRVRTNVNGKLKHLGYFNTEEKALQFIQNNIDLFPGAKPRESKI